jgi:hypothetical protein
MPNLNVFVKFTKKRENQKPANCCHAGCYDNNDAMSSTNAGSSVCLVANFENFVLFFDHGCNEKTLAYSARVF